MLPFKYHLTKLRAAKELNIEKAYFKTTDETGLNYASESQQRELKVSSDMEPIFKHSLESQQRELKEQARNHDKDLLRPRNLSKEN